MSLFSSLYTSAGGLLAQTLGTQFISENIANVSTTGYKGSQARFSDTVRDIGRFNLNEGTGGVRTERIFHIDRQGAIQQTSSRTDAAINGNGFFAVRPINSDEIGFSYTRNGAFGEDANGFLRNTAGFFLYGAVVTDQNTPPDVSLAENLVPVNVSAFDTSAQPTSLLELIMNLDARQEDIVPSLNGQQLPVNNLAASDTRSFTIVDSTGVERLVRLEFRKIAGPSAHFISQFDQEISSLSEAIVDINGPTPGIANNDAFTITVGGTTETFEFVTAAGGSVLPGANEVIDYESLRDQIDNFGGGGILQADLSPGGQLLVRAIDPAITVELSEIVGTPLSGAGTLNIAPDAGAESAPPDFIFEPEADITGTTTYPDQGLFPPLDNTTNPNPSNWWEITVAIDAITGTGTTPVQLATGLINFDGNGALNTPRDAFGNVTNGLIDLNGLSIDFDTTITGEESGFAIDIARTTQFSSQSQVIFSDQDGAPIGTRTGIQIDSEGFVNASYSNGQILQLYRVPIVTFNNANGLGARDGTVFVETQDSGLPIFQGANEGGAGFLQVSSLEGSNVDIADQFGLMIVSQRAYGLNSQAFQTANEMTITLSQLI